MAADNEFIMSSLLDHLSTHLPTRAFDFRLKKNIFMEDTQCHHECATVLADPLF